MKLLIVGIDPGTTVGYAALDLKGKPLKIGSRKNWDIAGLISEITGIGRPIIVATDKAKVPTFVQKAAVKLGARVIKPAEDMKADEKKGLARAWATGNTHELDALASAVYAYKRVSGLLRKLEKYIRQNNKQDISYDLTKEVLHEQASISRTAALLEPKKAEPVKISTPRDFEQEYFLLLEKHVALKRQLAEAKKPRTVVKIKEPRESMAAKARKSIRFKEKMLDKLGMQLKGKAIEIKELKQKNKELMDIIRVMDLYTVVPVLPDLSKNVSLKRVIYVENATITSNKTLEKMDHTVEIIITPKPSRSIRDFCVLNPKDLNIKKLGDIVLVSRKSIEKKVDRKKIFRKIVDDYKKGRN